MASSIDFLLSQLEECIVHVKNTDLSQNSQLHNILDSIFSLTKGQNEREVFGEKNGISKLSKLFVNFVSHYQKLIQRHPPPSFHGETENMTTILSTITLILRICRNLCANVPKNQTLIRTEKIFDLAIDFSTQLISETIQIFKSDEVETRDLRQQVLFFIRTLVQFLSNFVTSNSENQHFLWQRCFPHYFLIFLEVPDNALVGHLAMLIYNCIHNHSQRKRELLERKEGVSLLQHFLRHVQQEEMGQQQSTQHEWIYFIVKSTFLDDFPTLYTSLNDSPNPNSEQYVILHWLADWLYDEPDESKICSFLCSSSNLNFLIRQVKQFESLNLFDMTRIAVLSSTTPSPSQLRQYILSVDVLHMWLYIIGSLTVYLDNNGKSFCGQEGLLQLVLKLLQEIDKFEDELKFVMKSGNEEEITVQEQHKSKFGVIDMTFGLKKDIITIIGNLCYKHKHNQDEVRRLGGIQLILNHTSIDENNPFIREWSILAIRNLCEDNSENQQLIASLQPKGVIENELLNKLGLKAELLPSGKLKITPRSPFNSDTSNNTNIEKK